MRLMRQPLWWALCLTLSACGSAPPPLQPTEPGGGGAAAVEASLDAQADADLAGYRTPFASRTLIVRGDRHLVLLHSGKAFGTSPFAIGSLTTDAFNNKAAGLKFPALAGAYHGAYGWKYMRITPENAGQWSGDHGGPGDVSFLDSLGGEGDNAGSWVVTERYNDQEIRTEVFARTDVTAFDPTKVAYTNLGNTAATYALSARWDNDAQAATLFPSGCFVLYTRPDGIRDFVTLGSFDQGVTIRARGYVYAFFVTGSADEKVPSNLRVTFKKV